jgi:hypothetical protein
VHVTVYDERRPGAILAIGEFRIGSGVLARNMSAVLRGRAFRLA